MAVGFWVVSKFFQSRDKIKLFLLKSGTTGHMETISETDLILNPDGSIYHLHLLPGDIARNMILVGDPGRVAMVSDHFDTIELKKENREFVTHTGTYRSKRISVLSTGIGTDNIDIVLNELDALVNVDLRERIPRNDMTRLRIIRLGTSGALHADIPPGSVILSRVACGFDALYHYYRDRQQITLPDLEAAFIRHTGWKEDLPRPYFVAGCSTLAGIFDGPDICSGITISTPGFYAPQLRSIRLEPFDRDLVSRLETFRSGGLRINNFEMECSALYMLSALLGHDAMTLCVAVANRISRTFLEDYKPQVNRLIATVLDKLAEHD
jgi:uridine phosphorylase